MQSKTRILWLLNHTTLRRFEVEQLRALGITEIYAPKQFPSDNENFSSSVDYRLDENLTLPTADLEVLNRQDWYGVPDEEAWEIANRHFQVAFIGCSPSLIGNAVRRFRGAIVLRAFGLSRGCSYTGYIQEELGTAFLLELQKLGSRFWFGAGYDHLKDSEEGFLRSRNCFLPVGLEGRLETEAWNGSEKKLFFVCPRIRTSPYYQKIYQEFKAGFGCFDHVIGGVQPIAVDDPHVLGYVPRDVHERNMRELRVMYYHGQEPNHIHYHPFEAIRLGMPLVFRAGGMLDRLGGGTLPGRCSSLSEAQQKIRRILADDRRLIRQIRSSQECLWEAVKPESCAEAWRRGFQRILDGLESARALQVRRERKKSRIAVLVPFGYRGGSMRGAKLLARAIHQGSVLAGQEADVVFGHLDIPSYYSEDEFADLPPAIRRRPFTWRRMKQRDAHMAMAFAGLDRSLDQEAYQVPDDGIMQFLDCDLWVIVSDRLENSLLPIRPYLMMVYDYIQRYERVLSEEQNRSCLSAARHAQGIMVTTRFTRGDAIQYAGVPERKVFQVPMLAPAFVPNVGHQQARAGRPYFVWTTNPSPHKNHVHAFKALRLYYEKHGGQLECRVTGFGTGQLLESKHRHLRALEGICQSSPALRRNLVFLGELPDPSFQDELQGAEFLWHAGRIDNGTFSVVEAAHLGTPALSSDYPAMREIADLFSLPLLWMDPDDPVDMAGQLIRMEREAQEIRALLPSAEILAAKSLERLAPAYWEIVRKWL